MPIYTPPIPICALSGETSSGKTLFPIMSTQNALDKSKPPQAVIHDLEGSAETYIHSLNFDWRDIRGMLASGLHMKKMKPKDTDPNWKKLLLSDTSHVNDSPGVSMFRAVYMSILSIEPGQFLVCSIDPFTSLQMAAAEWLKLHPQAFHRTSTQYVKAGSIFLIPDARQMLEYFLTVECRSRFEMTVITFHQKNEWVGQGDGARKTGERISEHWELVDKVASLSATLDRRPKAKGKSAPRVPSGCIVWPYGKSRMMVVKDGELLPALPPRIPEFTPAAIRGYFENPPDYDKLKPEERMPADDMSDDERLRVQAGIAADQRMTAEIQATGAQIQQLGISSQAAAIAAAATPAQPATITTPPAVDVSVSPITGEQTAQIMPLVKKNLDPATFGGMLKRYGVAKLSELSDSKATDLHSELLRLDGNRGMAEAKAKLDQVPTDQADALDDSQEPATTTAVADPVIAAKRAPAILALAHVGKITPQRFGELLAEVTGRAGAKVSELTTSQAAALTKLIPTGTEATNAKSDKPKPSKVEKTESSDGMVTPGQLERLKKLIVATDWPRDKQLGYLRRLGYASFRSLQVDQADDLISKLLEVELGLKAKLGN